ncbi:hypothetical protein DTO063F5_7715 [Paecilomyces variotii]|nr:hypothetical protein DTO063F5_7715 [Paecilomyces variotii]
MTANPPSSPEDRRSGEEPEVASAKSSPQPSSERGEEKEKESSGSEERDTPGETRQENIEEGEASAPPLPDEEIPPLPNEAPPGEVEDDGWEPVWDANAGAYYFYNRFTGLSQWENPRVPAASSGPPGVDAPATTAPTVRPPTTGGYNPAIHGDYDPTAPYAQQYEAAEADTSATGALGTDPSAMYAATGAFNRFTGRWQAADLNPERYNEENKSRRQMHAFFDVDAAANSHDGRSLKAERSAKKLSKKELKEFKQKRRERKEERRRAWLRD